jgi:hypothetical protein
MSLNAQVFTDAGIAMLGAANAGSTLTVTKIVVGSGTAADEAALYPLTALITHKSDVAITRKTDLGGGKMIVSGALTEAVMTPGPAFSLRELGIMAKIGAGPEQLYSVSNVFGEPPDTVTPGGTSTHAFDITIVIDRATSVNITIGDPNTVDVQNIPSDPAVGPGLYAGRVGNVFQFKRLVAGPGIAFTEASDRVTVSQKVLGNLSLYVPASHPDAPGPEVAFATLQAALTYLQDFIIPGDKTVVINIYKGAYTNTNAILCLHPDAARIFIHGTAPLSKSVSAIAYLDTTHKSVTVDNTTGLAVGQRVHLADADGGWAGGCKITGIAGLVVTCSTEKRDARPNYTAAQAFPGARLTLNETVLVLDDPAKTKYGLYCPHGLGNLQNITMDGGLSCLRTLGDAWITGSSFWNAHTGLDIGEAAVATCVGECVFTQCDVGAGGSKLLATGKPYFNACTTGVQCRSAEVGAILVTQTNSYAYFSHNTVGIRARNNADFLGGFIVASSNNNLAEVDIKSSAVFNQPGGFKSFLDNNGSELNALNNSYILHYVNSGNIPSCNPSAGVLGNQNSLVHLWLP